MTTSSRRRELSNALAKELVGLQGHLSSLRQMVELLSEYVARAQGFAEVTGVTEHDIATSDHYALVALASQRVLSDLPEGAGSVEDARFRQALLSAMLSPNAVNPKAFGESVETLRARVRRSS